MKALLLLLSLLFAVSTSAAPLSVPSAPQIDARAWILTDYLSGQVITDRDPDTRVEPASLTKLMTAYLSFQAVKEGRLGKDQPLQVSEKAWRMEGSRMFVEPRKPVVVDDLLKGMIVQSGNDACVVLAEGIAGSEESFVVMMNDMARRLGMKDTHFTNSTGLPDPQHYTTVRDLTRLVTALIHDHPKFYAYYSLKEFAYNGITQPNRNRLLWLDPNVDGVKTGHTDNAGWCLISSARRGDRRLIAVVVGAKSDNGRAMESQRLLNYGFQFYETVRLYKGNQAVTQLKLYKGEDREVAAGFPSDFHVTVQRGTSGRIQAQLIAQQPMLAPIARGQQVATLRLSLDGKTLGDYPLRALKGVGVAGIFGRAWDGILLLFE